MRSAVAVLDRLKSEGTLEFTEQRILHLSERRELDKRIACVALVDTEQDPCKQTWMLPRQQAQRDRPLVSQ